MRKILIVCMGNICRSPVAERLLAVTQEAGLQVSSAGMGALVGHPADALAAEVAASNGVSLNGHVARQFNPALGREQDLILVMDPDFRTAIAADAPELLGRVMLYDHWSGGTGIPDPHGHSRAFHEHVFTRIAQATQAWSGSLAMKW